MKRFFNILLILSCHLAFVQNPAVAQKLEIPKTDSTEHFIHHTGYSFLYSEVYEQAVWVAYELTEAETYKAFDRTDKFMVDPAVTTGTATNKDYEGSGYDRGHLAPAADMGWSEKAMEESFYFSNMSPQDPGFNRGIWKKLEELSRNWAEVNDKIYIVTGPVLRKGLKTIGPNKVAVPEYYYKVILDYSEPETKGIGFIFRNKPSKDSLQRFAVSIDSVEAFTGLDFFPLLNDKDEVYLEKNLCIACWNWKVVEVITIIDGKVFPEEKPKPKQVSKPEPDKIVAVRCSGITKAGNRCKNHTTSQNGKCHLHE